MTDAQTVLDRVTRVPGVRGALIASAGDGLVIAEQLMDGVDGRAAAALAGSLVGRLVRTADGAGRQRARVRAAPRRAGLDPRGALSGRPGADRVVGPDANVGLARLEMLDAASRLD